MNTARAVRLVARREFLTQVRKKSFLISNVVILIAIVGGIVGYSIFSGGDDADRAAIGLVGDQSLSPALVAAGEQVGTSVEVSEIPDEQTARDRVGSGDLDVALIPNPDGSATAVTESEIDAGLRTVVDIAVTGQAQQRALTAQGVDVEQLSADMGAAVVTVETIDPPDPEEGQRIAMSIAAVTLLYMQILGFGMYVAMGVVEEKSSRVVELLLSTLRPLQLLWGKVIGIGAVGLVQLAAYGVAGVGAGLATGVLTVTGTALGVFAGTLGWFVLGFTFFAVLYAAAGSMVSRQEDVNSTTMPLMLLIMAMFFSAFSAVGNPDGTLSNVLSWIPPFSAILMPLRMAAGVTGPVQVIGTIALMTVVTVALSLVAAKIYQRSILRVGKTVSWREAFGR
ncbi:ABC-2 type transport system permease protein [Rhodococcus sp. PvR044]|jgi:ABC-2 type transport system permease protein|uniref:ABC transporter permease n=1 Tax=unclassified Rhodococcus (in: high G+C Gram-positive bacteria) TaxID=192944 RepID=UPI000BD3A185|nr:MULTISPECIES: ABC transporter permease [unclassified Rhodococcus (in: high G+C Gram-positive bacteria)]MBP1160449.1 ABC-2 type transport system permease protein [Rhodococcus sp. PvR099]PTR36851.1 ABC-2 type transport system permease protein [Rhodococcus sp. OK611]SNX93582.1 ABC-2 type transport system permease protein [Rhodococcus sp. OK270]